MALIDVDQDPWQSEIRGCETLSREISQLLAERSREPNIASDQYARISTNIRLRLKQFNVQIGQLEKTQPTGLVTAEERERRLRDVESLRSCMVRLQNQFERRRGPQPLSESGAAAGPSWGNAESTGEIRSHMRTMEEEQDRGLEALSKIVSRQKQIAETIDGELGTQNELLDDIAVRMDSTDENILSETRHVAVVDRKDSTCGYWTVIILLLIAIICVWVI